MGKYERIYYAATDAVKNIIEFFIDVSNKLVYYIWLKKGENKYLIFTWKEKTVYFLLFILVICFHTLFLRKSDLCTKLLSLLFFGIIIYIFSVYFGKIKKYNALLDNKNENREREFKITVARNSMYKSLVLHFFLIYLLYFIILDERLLYLLSEDGMHITVNVIAAFYVLSLIIYLISIRYNSIILKILTLIFMSVYALGGVYIAIFKYSNSSIPILEKYLLQKIVFLLSFILDYFLTYNIIIILILFTVVMTVIYAISIPLYQIKKAQYALMIMNIMVVIFTFIVNMNAENIIDDKVKVKNEIINEYYSPEMEKLKTKRDKASDNMVKDIEKEIIEIENWHDIAIDYYDKYTVSDIKNLSYFLLFPYTISALAFSLIWKWRSDKKIDLKLSEKLNFEDPLLLQGIYESVLNDINDEQTSQ